MSDLSIKVNIAGRLYPLTIDRAEEELIRKAAKLVDDRVRTFKDSYAVRDFQDPLAMTALQMATQLLKQKDSPQNNQMLEELKALEEKLSKELS